MCTCSCKCYNYRHEPPQPAMRPFFRYSFAGFWVALVKIKWKFWRYVSIFVISLVNIFYINYLIFVCINSAQLLRWYVLLGWGYRPWSTIPCKDRSFLRLRYLSLEVVWACINNSVNRLVLGMKPREIRMVALEDEVSVTVVLHLNSLKV